jgi:oligopeptidase B
MADRDDPEVIAYLKAENEYADALLSPTEELQTRLFEDIKARVQESDASPPVRHGGWWYYSRTVEGEQYGVMCRRADPERTLLAADVALEARAGRPASETVVLDENVLAAGTDHLAIGVFDISPDHAILAYAIDHDGSEAYALRFRDLDSGEDHADLIEGVYYGSAWAADNKVFFYVRPDEAMRPWQVWSHVLGTDPGGDRLVFQEDDERFFVDVDLSRSEQRIVIHSSSKTSSDARWLDARAPQGDPTVILARQPGVEYDVEHDGTGWLILSNHPGPDGAVATNFALYRLAEAGADPATLETVIAHRPAVKLESVEAFAGYFVVRERSETDGLERLRIIQADGSDHLVEQPEPVYTLVGEANPEWESPTFRFGYTSLVTPRSSVEYDVVSRRRTPIWSQLVLGGYDPEKYRTERLWATSADGTRVPLSIVARLDHPIDGSAPCVLYGYGAYEASIDPSFSVLRLNLLDRGVSFAIAHIRGGGELGRTWYEEGRMEHKVNTFTDFIAAATYLTDSGWARPGSIVARGASAGGLLMGAVTNMRPDLWGAVVAEVPFVDIVTTMSDTTLPLTVTEWEEWGDPVHDADAYERMLAYSPYDNVRAQDYPALYVTAGLNDPRVGYWEPAKWVAKLRAVGAGRERPLVLRTELGAGHGGPTGRYDTWKDEARVQAFMLTQVGLG